jgi:hypothetical protein
MSCQLYPGCRVPNNQVTGTLVAETDVAFCFWHRLLPLRGFIIGSLSFNSLYSYLRKSVASAFPYRSPPTPLGIRSIRWFGNHSWKPSPRGLLSSVIKRQLSFVGLLFRSHAGVSRPVTRWQNRSPLFWFFVVSVPFTAFGLFFHWFE